MILEDEDMNDARLLCERMPTWARGVLDPRAGRSGDYSTPE